MACAVTATFHDRDFYGWVEQQCAALRDHDSSRLDWAGLEEELEALGRQEYRELVSGLGVLLGHLLKWELQSCRRSRSWFCSIREQRRAIGRLLKQNPSLAAKAADALADGFDTGVDLVLRDTDLPLRCLPAASPWTLEQTLDPATLCAAAPSPQAAHVAMGVKQDHLSATQSSSQAGWNGSSKRSTEPSRSSRAWALKWDFEIRRSPSGGDGIAPGVDGSMGTAMTMVMRLRLIQGVACALCSVGQLLRQGIAGFPEIRCGDRVAHRTTSP